MDTRTPSLVGTSDSALGIIEAAPSVLLLRQSIIGIWTVVVGYIRSSLLVQAGGQNLYAVRIELPCTSTFLSFLAQHLTNAYRLAPHQSFLSSRGGRSTSVSSIYVSSIWILHTRSEANLGEKWDSEDVGNAGRFEW